METVRVTQGPPSRHVWSSRVMISPHSKVRRCIYKIHIVLFRMLKMNKELHVLKRLCFVLQYFVAKLLVCSRFGLHYFAILNQGCVALWCACYYLLSLHC